MLRLPLPHLKQERRPAMPMPKLRGIDPVPARDFAGLQEKQDRGRMRAAGVSFRISERLAIMPSLRVWHALEHRAEIESAKRRFDARTEGASKQRKIA